MRLALILTFNFILKLCCGTLKRIKQNANLLDFVLKRPRGGKYNAVLNSMHVFDVKFQKNLLYMYASEKIKE